MHFADRAWNMNGSLVGTILEIPAALDSQREIKAVDCSWVGDPGVLCFES